jgi:hypothetical protein
MQNRPKFSVAATFEKANTYVFAKDVIHNPKVGGSIRPLTVAVIRNHLLGKHTVGIYLLCLTKRVGSLQLTSTSRPGKRMHQPL